MTDTVLFVSDKRYINADILGGVQLCTHEYIRYITEAGFKVQQFHVEPAIGFATRVKIKMGIDVYEHYSIDKYLEDLTHTINSGGIKLVFFNQLNLAFWAEELKEHVEQDVKFIGLSHGNESADYIHEVTRISKPTKLQTWKLGRLLINEARLYSSVIDAMIVLSEQEVAINQWLGADKVLYLPRLLGANFIDWQPAVPNAGFVGTLDHLPNLLGIEKLADELKVRDFGHKLNVVGGPLNIGKRLEKKYSFIEYKGPIADSELINEVKTWSVFLNPVFWYARGASTKLAMAINWGMPCITTPAGRRGYHLIDETIVTDDNSPKSFANTLIKALDEPAYLQQLKSASENNAKNFDAKPYINLLKNFLSQLSQQ